MVMMITCQVMVCKISRKRVVPVNKAFKADWIPNARHFWFASTLVFTAQYFKCSGLRCSPLNAALGDREYYGSYYISREI